MFRLVLSLVVCVATVGLITGCGSDDGRPATVAATATVTYNGTAVEGAHVTLSPAEGKGDAAFGDTDAQGAAALRTSFGDGVVPGSYKVTVTKMVAEAAPGATENVDDEVDEEEGEEGGNVTHKSVLPEKYGKADESGFTATVTEDGENAFTFDLVD